MGLPSAKSNNIALASATTPGVGFASAGRRFYLGWPDEIALVLCTEGRDVEEGTQAEEDLKRRLRQTGMKDVVSELVDEPDYYM